MLPLLLACAPFANPDAEDTGAPQPDTAAATKTAAEVLYHPEGHEGSRFGLALAGATDLAGDGASVLLIGAPKDSTDLYDAEGVIWMRHADGGFERLSASHPAENLQFGAAIVSGGDIDGDGYTDLLINENKRSDAAEWGGALVVRYGSAAGPDTERDDRLYSPTPREQGGYGTVLAALGDIDGDGRDDFIVGDPGADELAGAVDLYYGGNLSTARLQAPTPEPGASFGSYALGGLGGFVVGSVHTDMRAWRYTTPSGPPDELDLRSAQSDRRWPAALHDTDEDGHTDLIAGPDAARFPGSEDGFRAEAESLDPEISAALGTPRGLLLSNKIEKQENHYQTGGAWLLAGGSLTALAAPAELPTSCLGVSLASVGDWLAVGDACQFTETGAVLLFAAEDSP